MENEFFLNLKDISIESIIISMLVFALTMLIKWPIKKVTSKLEENKRKAVNTVIVFIPMLLSFIFSVLYYGIFFHDWFIPCAFDAMASAYVLSVALYAIYSRVIAIVKASKTTEKNEDLSKEAISYIKKNIKTISSSLKVDEKQLESTIVQIDKLLSIKQEIMNNSLFQDIVQAQKIDNELSELESQKNKLTTSITEMKAQLENYQKSLN